MRMLSAESFAVIVTFCVSILNATTIFIVSSFFGNPKTTARAFGRKRDDFALAATYAPISLAHLHVRDCFCFEGGWCAVHDCQAVPLPQRLPKRQHLLCSDFVTRKLGASESYVFGVSLPKRSYANRTMLDPSSRERSR
jgi:hypothetical protein